MLFAVTWFFKVRLDYAMGWWCTRFAETLDPLSLFSPTLMFLLAIFGALALLASWRVTRRFGWGGTGRLYRRRGGIHHQGQNLVGYIHAHDDDKVRYSASAGRRSSLGSRNGTGPSRNASHRRARPRRPVRPQILTPRNPVGIFELFLREPALSNMKGYSYQASRIRTGRLIEQPERRFVMKRPNMYLPMAALILAALAIPAAAQQQVPFKGTFQGSDDTSTHSTIKTRAREPAPLSVNSH
jgi:hypothetical protein